MAGLRNLNKLRDGFLISLQVTDGMLNEIRIGGQTALIKHLDEALEEIRITLLNEFIDREPE